MATKSDALPTKYFKASNFADDWSLKVEIELCRIEKFENGGSSSEKPVVYFRKQRSGLVIGSTVWDQLADATGEEDSSDWPGHIVELFRSTTTYAGKTVPAIRVRKPGATPKKKAKTAAPPPEDVPFNDSVDF